MNPTTAPDTAQIINALPAPWQGPASLVLQLGVLLVLAGHYCAKHGGLRGIKKSLLDGNDTPKNP